MEFGVSYFGNRMVNHYRNWDLPEIVDSGCTFVVHTVSEEDLEFYLGTIKELVNVTHESGLAVYLDPWGVGGVFGGEAFSNFLVQNLDAWQIGINGNPLPSACLRNTKFRKFMHRWMEAAVSLGPDGIFWDEPHLFSTTSLGGSYLDTSCWCLECRKEFNERFGKQMPREIDHDVSEFREESIVRFLSEVCAFTATKGIKNAVCLRAEDETPIGSRYWEKIAQIDGIDILGVTPFWRLQGRELNGWVKFWAERVTDICRPVGIESQVWLQGFLIPAGFEEEISQAADIAVSVGVKNLAMWGFGGCAHISAMHSARPERVWSTMASVFRRLRS